MTGPEDPPTDEEIDAIDFTPTEPEEDAAIEDAGEPGGANFA